MIKRKSSISNPTEILMRLNFLIFPLLLLWAGSGSLFGKGLNTLAPAQENVSPDDEGWGI